MKPLAEWCRAEFIQKKVKRIVANENRIDFEDGTYIAYDVLALNIGSRTKGTYTIKGVWEHSLTTRPINDLLHKIEKKEQELI